MASISLLKFDKTTMKKPCNCLIVGKRSAGKSTLALDLSRTVFNDCDKIVLSLSERYESLWENNAKKHEILNDETSNNIISDATSRKAEAGTLIISEIPLEKKERKLSDNLSILSKSLNMNILHLSSYYLGLHPRTRANFDFFFLFSGISTQELCNIYENFASFVNTFETFKAIYDSLTEQKHHCMVINLCINSKNLEEKILYYKAEMNAED